MASVPDYASIGLADLVALAVRIGVTSGIYGNAFTIPAVEAEGAGHCGTVVDSHALA